ncbi:MAG: nucleotidyltransferase family protein [Legionellales bacterium]|nr:nucleotidyltransferase family protein [Legionellales bacterium]
MKLLQVVILAGGLATRLRPITERIPKALIDINGEPFIYHQLRLLYRQGVRDVVLCLGYLGEMVQEAVGNGQQFGMRVQYAFDGPVLLGTGGAIKRAAPYLEDAFFILYGDSYLTCDYSAAQKTFLAETKQGLMTVFKNQGQWDTSNVEMVDGRIAVYDKLQRNKNMHHIDYGLGIMAKTALNWIPDNEPYDLALLYQTLLKNDQLLAHEVTSRFYEVGSHIGIDELKQYLRSVDKDFSS